MPPRLTLIAPAVCLVAAGHFGVTRLAPSVRAAPGDDHLHAYELDDDPQRSLLVVSSAEHALAVQDPITGNRTAYFRVGTGPSSVAVSSDGRTAVVTNRGTRISGNSICVVDLYATNIVRTIPLEVNEQRADGSVRRRSYHRPSGAVFLNDQPRVLVTCAVEGALLLVDLIEARVIGDVVLEADQSDSLNVVVDHTGRYAFVGNRASGTVSVVKLDRMRVVETIDAGGSPQGMALHPTRNEIWVTNTTTNSISIIDADERDERLEFACGAMPVDVAFTPDGEHALVLNMQEGNISVLETESLRVRTLIDLNRVTPAQAKERPVETPAAFGRSPLPSQIVVDPSGERAWVATQRDDRITEVDLKRWRLRRSIETMREPVCLEWSDVDDGTPTDRIVPVSVPR
ncbi:MAG: YncE family protein [Planctomycetota bacterium]